MQAAALEELGSRDAQLSAQKAALEERGAELEAWAAQVSQGSGFRDRSRHLSWSGCKLAESMPRYVI